MIKRFGILFSLMAVVISLMVACTPPPPPPPPAEPPPPDYTKIDQGMKDPSDIVKLETLKDLLVLKHKNSIPRLLVYLKEYQYDPNTSNTVVNALKPYGNDIVTVIREKFWNSDDMISQERGFDVLSEILSPQEFLIEARKKFEEVPIETANMRFKVKLLKYYLAKANFGEPQTAATTGTTGTAATTSTDTGTASLSASENIVYIVNLLKEPNNTINDMVVKDLIGRRDPQVQKLITKLYFANLSDDEIKLRILKVLYSYDTPFFPKPKAGYSPLNDITVFLYSFGNVNSKIHETGVAGIKKYAFNDKDGKILTFIKEFENCDNPAIRASVIDLERFIPTRAPLPNETMPDFMIPAPVKRSDVCM